MKRMGCERPRISAGRRRETLHPTDSVQRADARERLLVLRSGQCGNSKKHRPVTAKLSDRPCGWKRALKTRRATEADYLRWLETSLVISNIDT